MEAKISYPSTALRARQPEVRSAAAKGPVVITDTGGRRYLLTTEDSFRAEIEAAAKDAAYLERVAIAVRRGRQAVANGAYVEGLDAAREEMERLRASRG